MPLVPLYICIFFIVNADTCTTTMSRNVTVIVIPIVALLIVFLLVIVFVVGTVVLISKILT